MVAARGAVGYVEKGLSPRRLVDEIVSVAGVLEVVERILDQDGELTELRLARQLADVAGDNEVFIVGSSMRANSSLPRS